MNLKDLDHPLPADAVEWRAGQAGIKQDGSVWCKVLAYITNRAIMERLDEICGKENWRNEYVPGPQGGILCGISIRIDHEWVTKWDGAENTDVEAVKGGLSDSMKRAAVQWGIGRYLYQLEEGWAETSLERRDGWERANAKKGKDDKQGVTYYWRAPKLPTWALPPDRPNGTAPRTTPPPHEPPVKAAKLNAKDAKLVSTFLDILKEATTPEAYEAAVAMLRNPDSGVSKAENVQQVKREIFEAMKKHPLYVPQQGNQAA